MNYQDFIWDLGGTLLDNYETSTTAFVETLAEYGYHVEHDAVYQALKISTDYAISQFAATIKDFRHHYKANEARKLATPVLFEGTKELLEDIKRKGGRHFLVSHRDHTVLAILKKTGIIKDFTAILTSENGLKRKPDPASFFYLKDHYHLQKVLVIGDRLIDVQAGHAAQMDAYLFDTMQQLREFIEKEDNVRRNQT